MEVLTERSDCHQLVRSRRWWLADTLVPEWCAWPISPVLYHERQNLKGYIAIYLFCRLHIYVCIFSEWMWLPTVKNTCPDLNICLRIGNWAAKCYWMGLHGEWWQEMSDGPLVWVDYPPSRAAPCIKQIASQTNRAWLSKWHFDHPTLPW